MKLYNYSIRYIIEEKSDRKGILSIENEIIHKGISILFTDPYCLALILSIPDEPWSKRKCAAATRIASGGFEK